MNLDLAGHIADVAHEHYASVTNGLRVANQLHRDNKHRAACELVESLRPLATTPDAAALIASHLVRTQGPLGGLLGTQPDAGPLDPEILDWADGQLDGEPFTTMHSAFNDYLAGDPSAIEQRVRPLLGHPTAIVRHDATEQIMGTALFAGDHRTVQEHAARLADATDPYLDDRPQTAHILHWLTMSAQAAGTLAETYERTRDAYEHLDRAANTTLVNIADAHAGNSLNCGQITEGLEAIRLARSGATNNNIYDGRAKLIEAQLLAHSGNRTQADSLLVGAYDSLREATDLVSIRTRAVIRFTLWFQRAVYQTHSDALAQLRDLTDNDHDSLGDRIALVLRIRLGDIDEELLDRLDELRDNDLWVAAMVDVTHARHNRDPEALVIAADRLEASRHLLEALEAITAAIEILQADGDQTAAKRLVPRHQELLARCPGLRWPLTTIAVDAPDLTKRERQVAEVAALGWSNRQISDEYSISVRTVENNLQRAYAKLGINRRTDLPTALGLALA